MSKKSIAAFYRVLILSLLIPIGLGCTKPQPKTAKSTVKTHYLRDEVQLLNNQQAGEIERMLSKHNAKGPGQIEVRIVRSLPPNTDIKAFAYQIINEGSGSKSDRILFLLAYKDRKLRIETSREVWPMLTDRECDRIIAQDILPNFKKNDFFAGIKLGLLEIVHELRAGS